MVAARMFLRCARPAIRFSSSLAGRFAYSLYPTHLTYAFLAGAEGAKGNDAEAKSALAEARRLFPQLTIKWLLTETPTPSIRQ